MRPKNWFQIFQIKNGESEHNDLIAAKWGSITKKK